MLTYQNILNNSTRSLSCKVLRDNYWDFMLYRGTAYGDTYNSENLIADFSTIDINDCIWYSTVTWKDAVNNGVVLEDIGFTGIDNGLISFRKDRISNRDFLHILTGSTYEIPEGDMRLFMTPVTGNTLNFKYPMYLIDDDPDGKYVAFKGGFYQGFYKLFGFEYQVLPNGPDSEWNLKFRLRPRSDYEVEDDTLNFIHPENKGIFFFIGTRAENKFLNLYKMDSAVTEDFLVKSIKNDGYLDPSTCGESGETLTLENEIIHVKDYLRDYNGELDECPEDYFADDYFDSGKTSDCKCPSYFSEFFKDNEYMNVDGVDVCGSGKCCCDEDEPCPKPKPKPHKPYFPETDCECKITWVPDVDWPISSLYEYKYEESSHCCEGKDEDRCKPKDKPIKPCDCDNENLPEDYYAKEECYDGPKSIEDIYFKDDIDIDEKTLTDSFGHSILKTGYYEIESDNKFLMFDRTPEGFTVKNWIEGTKVTLTGRNDWGNINYFPIMNRTKTGYTVHDIYQYNEDNIIPYNIYKDIKNNAFALRITENGAIGYRYSILDCNADNDQHYKVEEEYSKDGIIKMDVWNNINVRIKILNPSMNVCDSHKGKRKMKLYFYVNGFLIFISKELPQLYFKELNDSKEKQEAVPYNISLGGGTQGLLESILPDYYKAIDYIFPIEKNFAGTFLGDISDFKIYNAPMNYPTIKRFLQF